VKIVVVGLGYVGLPLAVALARKFDVTGFDIARERVEQLQSGFDHTREVAPGDLADSGLSITDQAEHCRGADLYIVTVPTPVDSNNRPDLGAVLSASRFVAGVIDPARRPTVVFESTVYPGVTEEVCGTEIERAGNLVRGRDFRLGYSPERINPGDREHRVEVITKVVAGEDEEVLERLSSVYGSITSGGVYRAASIKAAEAAKVIENAQRDINIAFMNEVAQILQPIGVSIWDVLGAARTKWNFLPFEPGLVGGHCIGVDPYYLSHVAQQLGHNPQVILAGRATNDDMGTWIADQLHARRGGRAGTALVMGITFKENVPDIRNSKVIDLIRRLAELGHRVDVCDPIADPQQVLGEYGLDLVEPTDGAYDLVIGAVPHLCFRDISAQRLASLAKAEGTIADLKGIWRDHPDSPGLDRWSL
jgi:UDP-N-acetyl-D-glucosamine/UDP-N-acetyl-D-galactosamine dehydrogenase